MELKATLVAAALWLAFLGLSLPGISSADWVQSVWNHEQYMDDFDGFIKKSYINTREAFLSIVEQGGETSIQIKPVACLLSTSSPISADIIIDEKRFNGVSFSISEDQDWMFLQLNVDTWIKRLDEGHVLKMRFKDSCKKTHTFSFNIKGNTHMRPIPIETP